jgi:hypothetical protein
METKSMTDIFAQQTKKKSKGMIFRPNIAAILRKGAPMTRTWTPESEQPKPSTGVDYHTVKEWFQQCRDMAAAVEAQKQKIQRIREVAEKTTPSLNGMPGGGGAGDKVGLAATDITDEQRRLQQMETDLCLLRIEATRRAYCITASKSSKKQADCLCLYYVKNKKQREVCEELGLSEENQVSIYIKWGSIYLAEIWDSFGNVAQTAQNPP